MNPRRLPIAPAFLLLLTLAFVVYPLARSLLLGLAGLTRDPGPHASSLPTIIDPATLARTIAISLFVGLASSLLAWPVAFFCRARPLLHWSLIPLAMPPYLAFAGWGLLRAPGTTLGSLIESLVQRGLTSLPFIVGQSLAILAIILWSTPIALLVLAPAARRIDDATLDLLTLETTSRLSRARSLARITLRPFALGALIVALLTLGSNLPLHLAQIRTYAINIWQALDLAGPDQSWRVWGAAAPLLLIATLAGWLLSTRLFTTDTPPPQVSPRPAPLGRAIAIALLILAVLAPLVLFLTSIQRASSIATFFRSASDAFATSAALSLVVALAAACITLVVWRAIASDSPAARALASLSTRLLLIASLTPGVLIGSSLAQSWGRLSTSATTDMALLAIAHLARFAGLSAALGALIARAEPRDARAMRILDGADHGRGWLAAALRPELGWLIASAALAAALSLHEIEAAVILMPPGDLLPRRVLALLHYARDEELCIASAAITLAALALAALASLAARRRT
ncbi:MAG: hypothetical protein JNL50_08290 [Phycisphaerae bacterium]|nr:hypothetical protein [Phycisphaerae bacterium]